MLSNPVPGCRSTWVEEVEGRREPDDAHHHCASWYHCIMMIHHTQLCDGKQPLSYQHAGNLVGEALGVRSARGGEQCRTTSSMDWSTTGVPPWYHGPFEPGRRSDGRQEGGAHGEFDEWHRVASYPGPQCPQREPSPSSIPPSDHGTLHCRSVRVPPLVTSVHMERVRSRDGAPQYSPRRYIQLTLDAPTLQAQQKLCVASAEEIPGSVGAWAVEAQYFLVS